MRAQFAAYGLTAAAEARVVVTGKLAKVASEALGGGEVVIPAAVYWAAAQQDAAVLAPAQAALALLDLSASGYLMVAVDRAGALLPKGLVVNPHCGAGPGVNLDRILQKLAIERSAVDEVLAEFLGEAGAARRAAINARADRCGVFSSSATISDKNQGIPLAHALATTIKSEVLKPCRKVPAGVDKVILTGRVFAWQFARDCAADLLCEMGVGEIAYDAEQGVPLRGLLALCGSAPPQGPGRYEPPPEPAHAEYPPFAALATDLGASRRFLRLPRTPLVPDGLAGLGQEPVYLAFDVGSTMAKVLIVGAQGNALRYLGSYGNSGETTETIKAIFRDLQAAGIDTLQVAGIGITGSARYQVQRAFSGIYPQLSGHISLLVENYAHARGSIDEARAHLGRLGSAGIQDLNDEFCLLVDIGGEDTKISTIALQRGELFDNAMNVKCSAGTGSLMDTLAAMFGISSIAEAYRLAYSAPRAYAISATCAVFLMENARRLQARGYGRDEILASACWAIVENMSRTLWNQIHLPRRTVVLLHGQPMLSEPLALAVAQRLQSFAGGEMFCLVVPDPGHRACFGLIETMRLQGVRAPAPMRLEEFVARRYVKKIITCHGAACGDAAASCSRTSMSTIGADLKTIKFSLGGCTAINELMGGAKKGRKQVVPDAYRHIWEFIDGRLPRSQDANRLVVPRSFAVSEWACFFASLMQQFGIPVHVDNVQADDVLRGQARFHIDTCAPHLGVVGQLQRLATQPHGYILAPQLEFLPVDGPSLGRTCTINQGGYATARSLAELDEPRARIHLFHLNLRVLDAPTIANELHRRLQPVFAHYGVAPDMERLTMAVAQALEDQLGLRRAAADLAADHIAEAQALKAPVGLVLGREYILNPGIYDSHAGRLLRDSGIMAIPAYVLDLEASPNLTHIYWRNPLVMTTVVEAVARRSLHQRLRHPRLRAQFEQMEAAGSELLPLVCVSTFLCGPDSVTTPLMQELTRNRPFLLIQSDAVIKELAHLENRVNTYTNQLRHGLHQELFGDSDGFEVATLGEMTALDGGLDRARDVLYLPTLGDNRFVTSVLRSAGYTCIDNYDDVHYDLPQAIRQGREMAGESVCAPLAAVYGDVLRAVEDFKWRRAAGDPQVQGKRRVVVFNNKGLGPCRQGQYVETHKLFQLRRQGGADIDDEVSFRFLVGHESRGFDVGLGKGLLLRAIQGAVLQGVAYQLYFDAAVHCRGQDDYRRLVGEYRALKQALFRLQELYPPRGAGGWLGAVGRFLRHRGQIKRLLRAFSARWLADGAATGQGNIAIHVDGETYMRVAQVEGLFHGLLGSLGFDRFRFSHAPLWCFLDYKMAGILMRSRETAADLRYRLRHTGDRGTRAALRRSRRRKLLQWTRMRLIYALFRGYLVAPLYRAARVEMPEPMTTALQRARRLIPTRRPGGELVPYVGEALGKLEDGFDLVFNVAPEGCMVSTMGEAMAPRIVQGAGNRGHIQPVFSAQGDLDEENIALAVLKAVGPQRLYRV